MMNTAMIIENSHFALLDIDDAFAIRDFAARILVEHPGLNVLVNNAGIMRVERVLAGPEALATAEATITTNLVGATRLTSALLPRILAQPQAAVVNVSSASPLCRARIRRPIRPRRL